MARFSQIVVQSNSSTAAPDEISVVLRKISLDVCPPREMWL